ncbi:MAG: hypothetical protein JWR59_632 [Brevundimonas sp.]|nr:hypothetical protein [Brevundimonas sp.]
MAKFTLLQSEMCASDSGVRRLDLAAMTVATRNPEGQIKDLSPFTHG